MAANFPFIKLNRNRYCAMDDFELIEEYRNKTEDAVIDEFFNRYIHLIFPACMKYLKDESTAKDAAMEVFAELGEKLLRFEIKHFKSWLYTVVRNHCLMRLRKESKEFSTDQMEIFQNFGVERVEQVHQLDEEDDLAGKLSLLMSRLRDGQKLCLEMMYFQNMSYKQISEATGYSLKQVKSYIQNGKRNLKILFEGE